VSSFLLPNTFWKPLCTLLSVADDKLNPPVLEAGKAAALISEVDFDDAVLPASNGLGAVVDIGGYPLLAGLLIVSSFFVAEDPNGFGADDDIGG